MKPFVNYLLAIELLLITTGCTSQREQAGESHETNIGKTYTAETPEMELNADPEEEVRDAQRRIEQNMETIRARQDELKIILENKELPTVAKLKTQDFKKDLQRLESNLEKNHDLLNKTSEEIFIRTSEDLWYELERAEDELAQINAELKEWYEKNLNY